MQQYYNQVDIEESINQRQAAYHMQSSTIEEDSCSLGSQDKMSSDEPEQTKDSKKSSMSAGSVGN